MERDVRRDRGQWRGCYEFKNIICDGDRPATARRNGGLKMGQPYYYYYELDGSVEAHDPSRPTTSACPYLPGQTVNMMHVPAEVSDRKRSASLSSVRDEDFKTMDPNHKFITPRAAPTAPEVVKPGHRAVTSQTPAEHLKHKRSARSDRSISPTPSWWSPRKLFHRKNSPSSSSNNSSDSLSVSRSSRDEHRRSITSDSSESSRTRAMSPEDLRKFLCDDVPTTQAPMDDAERLFLSIPDDIAEEDDDNFATSAISENGIKTILSPPPPPPPFSRNHTPNTLRRLPQNESVVTLTAAKPQTAIQRLQPAPFINDPFTPTPTSRFSFSSDEGSVFGDDDDDDETDSSTSPEVDSEIPSFYHSEADEEDDRDSEILSPPSGGLLPSMGRESLEQSLAEAFRGYRLPLSSADDGHHGNGKKGGLASPAAMAPRGGEASVSFLNSPPLLAAPVGSVVDDFVSEMSGCIQSRWA
ncbi:hypothetical protein VMCG_00704 [Cytospora schulzeri]|uniref:Uncharacterized protein n=1 Tax=Cytospora schulzeri TaxID=448051 RepID=A0A423X7Y5_9PEZI|nr:hypothetical protein VMCG_00704 [Valsa malicola]